MAARPARTLTSAARRGQAAKASRARIAARAAQAAARARAPSRRAPWRPAQKGGRVRPVGQRAGAAGGGDESDSEDSRILDPAGGDAGHPGSGGESAGGGAHLFGQPAGAIAQLGAHRVRVKLMLGGRLAPGVHPGQGAGQGGGDGGDRAGGGAARQGGGGDGDRAGGGAALPGQPVGAMAQLGERSVRIRIMLGGRPALGVGGGQRGRAAVDPLPPRRACEHCHTIPYEKGVCCSYLGVRMHCLKCHSWVWPQEKWACCGDGKRVLESRYNPPP